MYNIFKTKEGKVVIAQKPNLPLVVWAISYLITQLPLRDTFLEFFQLLSFGALFTWAWLELFQGVNLFRRLLGLAVVVFILIKGTL